MKWNAYVFSIGFLLTASLMAETLKTGGNAQIEQRPDGKIMVTFMPDPGWPHVSLPVPFGTWGNGTLNMTIRQMQPSGPLPVGISIGTPSREKLLEAGYIHHRLVHDKPVDFSFPEKGTHMPDAIIVTAKHPRQKVVLEISKIARKRKDGITPRPKVRLASLPPVRFRGRPFFPIGSYDMHECRSDWSKCIVDQDFLDAGGNFSDFGRLWMPHKLYETSGQPVLYKALERLQNDPKLKHVAVIVQLNANMLLDDSQVHDDKVGIGADYIPARGIALEKRKQALKEALIRLRNCPNVIGYTLDEPENVIWTYYKKKYLEERKKKGDDHLVEKMQEWIGWPVPIIRKYHPEAKLMPIIAWWSTYEGNAPLFDVLIANTYPKIGKEEFSGRLYDVSYDAARAVEAARKTGGGRTVIYMPPMYDIHPGIERGMTLREQRYLNFAPITRGVMGIHGWRLQRCSSDYRKSVIFPSLREVSALSPFFLGEWHDELVESDHDQASVKYLKEFKIRIREVAGLEDAPMIQVDGVPDVTYCLRRHPDGRYLLLVASNRREPVTVHFRLNLKNLPPRIKDNLDKHYVNVDTETGVFGDAFAPFDVHAYVFTTTK